MGTVAVAAWLVVAVAGAAAEVRVVEAEAAEAAIVSLEVALLPEVRARAEAEVPHTSHKEPGRPCPRAWCVALIGVKGRASAQQLHPHPTAPPYGIIIFWDSS